MNQRQKKISASLLAILVLLIILTGAKTGWISIHQIEEVEVGSQGKIDVSDTLLEDNVLKMNGKWNFTENALLTEYPLEQIGTEIKPAAGTWDNEKKAGIVYGTYHLRIMINEEDLGKRLAIHFPIVQSAANVLINGELAGSNGNLSLDEESFSGSRIPFTVDFISSQQEVDILVHVANKGKWNNAGIPSAVYIGSEETIDNNVIFSVFNQLLVSIIFFIYFIFGVFLYFRAGKKQIFGSFFFLAFFSTLAILVSDNMLLFQIFPVSYETSIRLGLIVYTFVGFWLTVFFKTLLFQYAHHKLSHWFLLICLSYIVFICFAPIAFLIQSRLILTAILLASGALIGKQVFDMLRNGEQHAIYLLLITICMVDNISFAFIRRFTVIEYSFYPINFILIVLLFSMFWITQYFDSSQKIEKLSEQLQENIAKKDEFLANTSHELRNPLHAIINISRSLQQNDAEQETERTKGLTLISSVGERMAFLLDNLLDASLLQEKEIQLNCQKVYLQSIVPGVIQTVEFLINKKDVLIIDNIPPDTPPLYADEGKVVQILFNLLRNAVDYTEKGTITIHAAIKRNKAYIQIQDTGVGMSEELQKKIFQRYERGNSNLSAASSGIGLGLNIAKELIELHNGSIRVKSELNSGSTFSFTIPVVKENKKTAPLLPVKEKQIPALNAVKTFHTTINQRGTKNRPKILAVDDDPLNLEVLRSILGNDYDVHCVSDGREALDRINQETWDLIISDVMMPYVSGYKLTSSVRKRYSLTELPVLLLTAIHKSIDINTGFSAGANDYLLKPVSDIELKARVQSLIHLKRSAESRLQMEAAWLQAQVEPHFLFNTITSIMVLFEQEPKRGRELMEYFTFFLQTSYQFHNTSRLVSIENEVELAESYLYIMKERFQNKLEYTVQCDDEAKKYVLPPLTIQPLVENAVKHGILSKVDGGTIKVVIKKGEQIEITVQDDGNGIGPDKIEKIRKQEYKLYPGIGLRNVNERLKGHFGVGIHIESTNTKGTLIQFTIPAIRSAVS